MLDLPRTLGLIARIEQAIARMDAPGQREQRVLQRLACQRECLDKSWREIAVPAPVQVIHYDCQETNVVFEGDEIAGVLDWDDSGLGPRSYDILPAMHLMLFLQPEACKAFLEGYRQSQPLLNEELVRGTAFYGLARDCSTWLYEEVYLLDNQRVRERFEPEPFVPFERSWQVFARAMHPI